MDQLWAAWRGEYVRNPSGSNIGCFLCESGRSEAPCRDTGVVYVAQHSIVLLNRYPYSPGHVMIAPRVHGGEIQNLGEDVYDCLMHSMRRAAKALDLAYAPHGMNIGMNLGSAAGAGVPEHCQIHVVPRWSGDTNFMPVVGQVKVLSETLDTTWQRIADAMHSLGAR
ncbi:MAG: HIT family protein [Bacteroidota bacterium]